MYFFWLYRVLFRIIFEQAPRFRAQMSALLIFSYSSVFLFMNLGSRSFCFYELDSRSPLFHITEHDYVSFIFPAVKYMLIVCLFFSCSRIFWIVTWIISICHYHMVFMLFTTVLVIYKPGLRELAKLCWHCNFESFRGFLIQIAYVTIHFKSIFVRYPYHCFSSFFMLLTT